MPIIRPADFIDEYRARASASDINEMSGRSGRRYLTDFVAANIVAKLPMRPGELLVDIGCGDGTVLQRAVGACPDGEFVGVLPTEEEAERARRHVQPSEIEIRVGMADSTGIPDGVADKIVCNSVLLIVPDIDRAIREIARIAKPGATVFIGEMPKYDEQPGRNYGNSVVGWLYFVLRTEGVLTFARALLYVTRAAFWKEPAIIPPRKTSYMDPDVFVRMVERRGFRLIEKFPHLEIDAAGTVYESVSRVDYLFRRCPSEGTEVVGSTGR